MVLVYGMPPLIRFVRELKGEWYLIREVAEMLGLTRGAVYAAGRRHPRLGPGAKVDYGKTVLMLYGPADVEELRKYFETREAVRQGDPPGRPRLWTHEEWMDRRRRMDSARYWAIRASKEEAADHLPRAGDCRARSRALKKALLAEHAKRRAEVAKGLRVRA